MLRTMVSGTTAAAVFGILGATFGSLIFGTGSFPFIAASSLGFVFGSLRWYHASTTEALLCLDNYPTLMRLHLMENYPRYRPFRLNGLNYFRSEQFENSWVLKSMFSAAWLTAQPALEEIHTARQAAIVVEYTGEIAEIKHIGSKQDDKDE